VVVVALRSLQLQARPARAPRARLQCWLGLSAPTMQQHH
jgi:hypothetical protein